jgi:hypothetical protein
MIVDHQNILCVGLSPQHALHSILGKQKKIASELGMIWRGKKNARSIYHEQD